MKVAWFHKFGPPEVLVHEEGPKPAPKPGDPEPTGSLVRNTPQRLSSQ